MGFLTLATFLFSDSIAVSISLESYLKLYKASGPMLKTLIVAVGADNLSRHDIIRRASRKKVVTAAHKALQPQGSHPCNSSLGILLMVNHSSGGKLRMKRTSDGKTPAIKMVMMIICRVADRPPPAVVQQDVLPFIIPRHR
ncbi:hypothetical protein EVAR_20876_1 [Eumeta japonica]|uniref:Uncharacterized protein n=1 Tax=Eumeta variegata TaxID=151549 RepID=A0A4C1UWN3_EUMVA|nr:hypothetical protein EVAR_20876_1 [Eumeta japonica]